MLKFFNFVIGWAIILIPFTMAISPAPMNVFMGILIVFFLLKKILNKESIIPKTAVNLQLFFFFLITCISLFNSIDLKDSMRGGVLRLLQYIFIYLILASEVKEKIQMKKIIYAITLGAFLASLDAIWQVFSGHDFIRGYEPILNIGLVRATASFKDSNTFGIYLSAIAPLVFGMTLYHFKGKKKLFFGLVSLVTLAAIFLTYSRPTILAIYIVFLFFAWLKKQKLFLYSLIILVLISPFIAPKAVKNWAKEVNYNPLRFMCNDDRIAVYRNSLHMIKAHPLIGVGTNAFMNSYKKYKEFPEYRNVVTLDEMKAHNLYLHLAGEIGLIGLAIFFWLIYGVFSFAKKIYRSADERFLKIAVLSLVACLIAFLINGLTESSLSYSRVALIFWYLAGFLSSLGNILDGDKKRFS